MAEASARFLLEQATKVRRIAREVGDERARHALIGLAEEYEAEAAAADSGSNLPLAEPPV